MKKLLASFCFVFVSITLFSQTTKIKDLENQRKSALREIQNTTLLLDNTKKSTETLLSRINILAEQVQSRSQVILLLNQEIQAIGEEETKIGNDIVSLEGDLSLEQNAYAKAVQGVAYRKQNKSKLLFILSGKSLSESLRRMRYLKDYSLWRKNQAQTIRSKQIELTQKKENLVKMKASKIGLLSSRKQEQLKLEEEEKNHKKEVEEASKKQKELQELITTKQQQANRLNNQIQQLIAEEVARQEREARRLAEEQERKKKEKERRIEEQKKREREKNSTSNKNTKTKEETSKVEKNSTLEENSTKTYVTKENVQLSSNFASNKGRLPMPISGSYKIVGKFGVHKHDQWKVTTNSNGIDIQGKPGAQAKSVFEGEVSRVVAFPGFNNCIIIRHGGYYTFYGNIQNVAVKQGQKVSTGQTLGVVFTDSETNNSVLHFQLWKGTAKLNPEPWLR